MAQLLTKKGKTVFKVIIIAIVVLFVVNLFTVRVPGGYVGSIYSISNGITDRIVDDGWKVIKPWEKVSLYSIATEKLELTKAKTENSSGNESFNATCKDGVLNVDVEMDYHFEEEDIPAIAKKYRNKSGAEIIDTIIKSKVRTYVNEVTSQYTILEAYMDKKSELNMDITKHLQAKLAPYGVVVESATLPRTEPDEAIKVAITERSKRAQEVEEAKQRQEKEKIEAETKRIEAKGEADAAIEKARGEAEANEIMSKSLTENLLELERIKARQEHGWVTVQGADAVIDNRK